MLISPVFDPAIVALAPTDKVVLVVVPPAIENPAPNAVGVKPFIVLFVNASVPANVATVPVVGKVTFVAPVVVKVTLFAPLVVKFPPSVIVFPVLSIPVPPFVP